MKSQTEEIFYGKQPNWKHWKPEDWAKVLWTDEKKFELFNSKRRKYVRRKIREPLRPDTIQPTVKHGGSSVMVWGCFMGGSVSSLYIWGST